MVRRAVALGGGFVVLLVLFFGISGCLENRREQALKDYARDVAAVVREANDNQAEFFRTLSGGGDSATEVQTQLNGLRVRAEGIRRDARDLDAPGDMSEAQDTLLLSLGLVQGAVGAVAEKLPGALASDSTAAEAAVKEITGQMQAFTAADVVYQQRTAALIAEVLSDKEIGGQPIQRSAFMQNLGWLDLGTVADRINSQAGAGAGTGDANEEPTPGSHGHGLVSTKVGDVTLQPGGAANRVTIGSATAFQVTFANQGDNEEEGVVVSVRVSGSGEPITASRTVPQTRPGSEASVSVPLRTPPPVGTAVTVEVEVRGVPGEEKTDNNKSEYTVLFARG